MPLNETDTCHKFVTPKLIKLGWDDAPYQIAEVEDKQTKDCAEILGLNFTYSTNGNEITEFDFKPFQESASTDLSALVPSLLDKAFKGEL